MADSKQAKSSGLLGWIKQHKYLPALKHISDQSCQIEGIEQHLSWTTCDRRSREQPDKLGVKKQSSTEVVSAHLLLFDEMRQIRPIDLRMTHFGLGEIGVTLEVPQRPPQRDAEVPDHGNVDLMSFMEAYFQPPLSIRNVYPTCFLNENQPHAPEVQETSYAAPVISDPYYYQRSDHHAPSEYNSPPIAYSTSSSDYSVSSSVEPKPLPNVVAMAVPAIHPPAVVIMASEAGNSSESVCAVQMAKAMEICRASLSTPAFNKDSVPCFKRKFSESSKSMLMDWLMAHKDNPYPSSSEKESFMKQGNLSKTQVEFWFKNARSRILKKKLVGKVNKRHVSESAQS